ncbi:MAG: serine/threonine-protein kinase [Candidatus Electryonea clarkiae]|nr:serine/threonine-protein kinase [Candidatus Electryonea clarkiae]MDP8286623.1 serine/threonine-protein kinase [Candidatus Electryonea clarkiae]
MTGRIGKDYEVIREIRRGPWVTVYEANHRVLGRRRLVKWLNPEHSGDEEMSARLEREARLGAKVEHPNAARIHDVSEADGRPYVAMEWIEGEDLEMALEREGVFSFNRTLRLSRDLLNGLAAIHEEGVVHRDLSPANVRLTEEGVARITDFGLATSDFDLRYTLPGSVVGTPGYLAPEQASGKEIDSRADLFALGVLIHEALTGKPLFRDKDLIATLKRVRSESAPSLNDIVDGLPEGFADWVAKLLEKKPGNRWQSASQANEALTELIQEKGWEVEETSKKSGRSYWFTIPATLLPAIAIALLLATMIQVLRPSPKSPIEPPRLVPGDKMDTPITGESSLENNDGSVAASEEQVERGMTEDIEKSNTDTDFTPVRTTDTRPEITGDPDNESQKSPETSSNESGETDIADNIDNKNDIGILMIQSRPWADVYMDQERIGATPGIDPLSIQVGEIHLIFDNPGFPPIPFDTMVSPSGTTKVFLELADMVGTVSISATPWAHVFIDDNPIGDTPLNRLIHLSPGRHLIKMTHPEFGEEVREIHLEPGETATINVDMIK